MSKIENPNIYFEFSARVQMMSPDKFIFLHMNFIESKENIYGSLL